METMADVERAMERARFPSAEEVERELPMPTQRLRVTRSPDGTMVNVVERYLEKPKPLPPSPPNRRQVREAERVLRQAPASGMLLALAGSDVGLPFRPSTG
jgi:hypothetical protein